MSFDHAFMERLRDALPLSELAGRRLRLMRRGREFTALCPFHNEKTPSFTINDDKQFFHCFGCGAHGDVIGWTMRMEGLSFPEAVERLAELAGIPLPQRDARSRAVARERADLYQVMEQACHWYQQRLMAEEGAAARSYLEGRGLTMETVARFRIGFAPGRRGALHQALSGQGIGEQQLVAAGLARRPEGGGGISDYFFGRIVFPITDRRGRIIGFGGRAMNPDARAKYLNSPDSSLFNKGRTLYNLHHSRQAAHDGAEVLVVEGYMDVIALAQAGFPAVVAPLGTALTEEQIVELWRLAPEPVLCLDGDAAGQRAAGRAAQRALPLLKPGYSLHFAMLPRDSDPDALVRSGGPGAMRQVVEAANSLETLVWEDLLARHRLDSPERQAALRQDILRTVAKIQDSSVQTAYRSSLLERYFAILRKRRATRQQGSYQRSRSGPAMTAARPRRLVRPTVGGLRRRPAQILLAFAISYPHVTLEYLEDLALQKLQDPELDALRGALVDMLAAEADLDSQSLGSHLRRQGYTKLLDRLLGPEIMLHEPMLRGQAAPDEVRQRFIFWLKRVAITVEEPEQHGAAL